MWLLFFCLQQHTHSLQISNPQLQDRVAAFGTGLLRLAGLEAGESNVLLLLNDSIGMFNHLYHKMDLILAVQNSSLAT
jgi:acyl-CoA synthetase (AMP-forming)/AMP-acid ligase II